MFIMFLPANYVSFSGDHPASHAYKVYCPKRAQDDNNFQQN